MCTILTEHPTIRTQLVDGTMPPAPGQAEHVNNSLVVRTCITQVRTRFAMAPAPMPPACDWVLLDNNTQLQRAITNIARNHPAHPQGMWVPEALVPHQELQGAQALGTAVGGHSSREGIEKHDSGSY